MLCALLPASLNAHILPCPWFIHQNQEVNIGATLFIKTLNCRLYTDVTNFSTNDLFFFCSRIQSRKTTMHFVIMSRPEGFLLKAQSRSLSCFKLLNDFPHSFNKTGAPGPSLPAPHTLALLTPSHLTHAPLTQGTQAQRPLVTSLNPKLSPGSALAAPSA